MMISLSAKLKNLKKNHKLMHNKSATGIPKSQFYSNDLQYIFSSLILILNINLN